MFNSPSGKETIAYIQNLRKVPSSLGNPLIDIPFPPQLLSSGYYFSYTWDLTLSKVKMASNSASDARFCWNGHIMRDLIKFKINSRWLIPMIQVQLLFFNDSLPVSSRDTLAISVCIWLARSSSFSLSLEGRATKVAPAITQEA